MRTTLRSSFHWTASPNPVSIGLLAGVGGQDIHIAFGGTTEPLSQATSAFVSVPSLTLPFPIAMSCLLLSPNPNPRAHTHSNSIRVRGRRKGQPTLGGTRSPALQCDTAMELTLQEERGEGRPGGLRQC